MPRVKRLLADEGASFTNMFVTTPQCCPSHVTILTGQYPHNSGVLNNWFDSGGGFQTFVNNGGDKSTIATWLQAAGYRTARFGKYLVEYDSTTYIPPGWSEWYAYYGSGKYFNYTLNENGTQVSYSNAPSDYSTDVLTEKVIDFIDRAEENEPFFVFFAPAAPHGDGVPNGPATPAPRHKGMFAGTQAPRTPSFNEGDVSDKPPAIGSLPLLTAAQITAIDSEHQTRIESLQSVDEAVENIVNKLAELGQLENTYVNLHFRQRLPPGSTPSAKWQDTGVRRGHPRTAHCTRTQGARGRDPRPSSGHHRLRPDDCEAGPRQAGPRRGRAIVR